MSEHPNSPKIKQTPTPTAIILGGGIGGLVCGAILAKNGFQVSILEKNSTIGGGLASFRRGDTLFPTGMHTFGGFLGSDAQMAHLFRYLGIADQLDLRHNDPDCNDEIICQPSDLHLRLPRGRKTYTDYLCQQFPNEADGIRRYIDAIYNITSEEDLFLLQPDTHDNSQHSPLFFLPYNHFIARFITSPHLQSALAYLSLLYAGVNDQTPAYIHALVTRLHIEGCSAFAHGSQQMADALISIITTHGGTILTRHTVQGITVSDHEIKSIQTTNGQTFSADLYVSDLPTHTLLSVAQEAFSPAFRRRITQCPDTYSTFKLFLRLKPETIPHSNHPIHIIDCQKTHKQDEPLTNTTTIQQLNNQQSTISTFTSPNLQNPHYAETLVAMMPMSFNSVSQWSDSTLCHRPQDYRLWKQQQAEQMIERLSKIYPDLKNNIQSIEAATPLTIRDYLGNRHGSLYGIARDSNNLMQSQFTIRTRLSNLYLTGQDINIHGLVGVSLTAIATAETILGQTIRIEIAES